jgi:hypothetical protein
MWSDPTGYLGRRGKIRLRARDIRRGVIDVDDGHAAIVSLPCSQFKAMGNYEAIVSVSECVRGLCPIESRSRGQAGSPLSALRAIEEFDQMSR